MRATWVAGGVFLCGAFAACVGQIGEGGDVNVTEQLAQEVSVAGMRRLSAEEYRQTVVDLLGLEPAAARELLPVDTFAPFDNDYTLQTPSEALIKGAELLAGDIAEAIVGDDVRRTELLGCSPKATPDDACLRGFIRTLGRRALRRPLSDTEVDRFAALSVFGDEDVWRAVSAVLRAFLQHPEFLYRIEVGAEVAGQPELRRLNDYEVATRLSYFLLGSTTPDWLLDKAQAGALVNPEGLRAAAEQLLSSDDAKTRMARFHGMWLSYSQLSREGLLGEMHEETETLLNRVIFEENRPWLDVITMDETFVTPELAAHYDIDSPGSSADWVKYGDSGRKGLLSHGTFLSAVPKFGDTSPTQRGLLVRTRLFCQEISKPPDNLMVDVDTPPMVADKDACKEEQYFMAKDPLCKNCHTMMDDIGFGLENYDASGRFRETEFGRPDCEISGEGQFLGLGTFNGPAELADLAAESGQVERCVATQLYRFAIGRTKLDQHDNAFISRMLDTSGVDDGLKLKTFIVEYVSSEAFRFRRNEKVEASQ